MVAAPCCCILIGKILSNLAEVWYDVLLTSLVRAEEPAAVLHETSRLFFVFKQFDLNQAESVHATY